jgi:hypothetical protein
LGSPYLPAIGLHLINPKERNNMPLAFEKQAKESNKAFAAFVVYLGMGSERSLEAVRQKCGKSARLIERWSSRWRWTERVAAHTSHLAVVEREATEALARGKAAEWLTRQQQVREREWEMHEKCIAAAKRALDAFMAREKVYANLADISRILELASKLGRLSCDMATDKTEKSVDEVRTLSVEFKAAIEKIYGQPVPAQFLDVESTSPQPAPQSGEGERRVEVKR